MVAVLAAGLVLQGNSRVEAVGFSMDRPNTKIHTTQNSGSGNRIEGVEIQYRLMHLDGAPIAHGNYGGSGTGWMVSLSYNLAAGVQVKAQLLGRDTNEIVAEKFVLTGTGSNWED
jgi:hypothetical protein